MKNILLISAIILSGFNAYGAVPTARSSASVSNARTATGRSATSNNTVSQTATRSAVASRSAPTSTPSSTVRGRSAVAPASATRAAKQSVISTGTKVAAAAQNTAVDQVCWEKFSGCMDSFCMLDNANGGRCICSDKNAEYDAILAEIQALDEQSYQMATVGVERIEMGDDADAVMKRTQEITKSIEKDAEKAKSKRQSLDLSAWNINAVDFDADVEDMFSITSDGISIEGKTGDALYRVSAKLCNAQVPECASQAKMMELMYQQRVRSDCTAYENSLRQSRTQSAQKLAAAQGAMREAALEQYRNANKYDLGQCTVQFKQCMQTTGGCGEDFTGCVEWSVREGLVNNKSGNGKTIKGTFSNIELSGPTYDVLLGKKELCMGVTQQCVNVRDQVWDTFLREVAPQVKSAELIVESNMRTSCIANISSCFQKACRDNTDPNDPDGSYDMCLTRPETLRSACKVEIDPCEGGIPNIMDYVRARLASMRVDSCTREFKECLTSEDRCGKDYTQCIGLDTDTIVKMCPDDKLPGCYYEYKNDKKSVQDTLAEIATGIFLNIDNNMLTACQRAADAAMIRVCGSTENCDDIVVDNGAGTRSFKYEICKNTVGTDGTLTEQYCRDSVDAYTKEEMKDPAIRLVGKLSGLVYWGNIGYTDKPRNNRQDYETATKPRNNRQDYETATKISFTTEDEYLQALENQKITLSSDDKKAIHDRVFGIEIRALTSAVENAINAIESDQMVQYCMTGRRFQGTRGKDDNITYLGTVDANGELKKEDARFPNLTSQMRQIIANSALKNARDNYMKKYDEEMERMAKDGVKVAQIIDEETAKAKAVEMCIAYGDSGSMPVTKGPKASNTGKWLVASALIAGGILLTIFGGPVGAVITAAGIKITGVATAVGIVASVGTDVGLGIDAANNPVARGGENIEECENTTDANGNKMVGCSVSGQWNYKEKIVTIPNYETGVCTKIKTTAKCAKTKKDYCEEWEDEKEDETTINLLN